MLYVLWIVLSLAGLGFYFYSHTTKWNLNLSDLLILSVTGFIPVAGFITMFLLGAVILIENSAKTPKPPIVVIRKRK